MRRIVVLLALSTVVACHSAAKAPATAPAPVAAQPAERHTNENLNGVLWMQTAAEYRASAQQAYRVARMELDAALVDAKWTAAAEQTGDASALPPAVILDLDETVIDNSASAARQVTDSVPYSPAAWARWVEERKARAIPGAVEFLQYAHAKGVTLFYVTNRDHAQETATRENLAALGVPLDGARDTVLMRNENGWTASDKSARRQAVAANFRILLLVGDNFEDFVSGTLATVDNRFTLADRYADYWGQKWIILPNPTYGSWESAISSGQGRLTDAQFLALKYKTLRVDR